MVKKGSSIFSANVSLSKQGAASYSELRFNPVAVVLLVMINSITFKI